MVEPKRYRAMSIDKTPDVFTGKRRVWEGYYVKQEGTSYAWDEGQEDDSRHFIFTTSFADWNMPRELEIHEIDITTLEEL